MRRDTAGTIFVMVGLAAILVPEVGQAEPRAEPQAWPARVSSRYADTADPADKSWPSHVRSWPAGAAGLVLSGTRAGLSEDDTAALLAHPRVSAAMAGIDAAAARRSLALANWAPDVSARAEYGVKSLRDRVNGEWDPRQVGPRRLVAIDISQPLLSGYPVWRALEAANADIAGREAEFDRVLADVMSQHLLNLVRIDTAARIVAERSAFLDWTYRARASVLEKAKAKEQDAAELPRADERVARAKAALSDARAELIERRADYLRHWGRLAPVRVTRPVPFVDAACSSLDPCQDLVRAAPAVRVALADLVAAEHALERETMARAPRIEAYGTASRTDTSYPRDGLDDFESRTDELEAGIRLRQDLPFGLVNQAERTRLTAERAAAQARLDLALRVTAGEAGQALSSAAAHRDRIGVTRAQVAASDGALKAIEESYVAGGLGIRDVLDQQEAASHARVQLERARADLDQALLRLNSVLGIALGPGPP